MLVQCWPNEEQGHLPNWEPIGPVLTERQFYRRQHERFIQALEDFDDMVMKALEETERNVVSIWKNRVKKV